MALEYPVLNISRENAVLSFSTESEVVRSQRESVMAFFLFFFRAPLRKSSYPVGACGAGDLEPRVKSPLHTEKRRMRSA
ncbi:uncharacterized [Tachysurus ichikawai]